MAKRKQYINPLSMGLLGGLGAGFKELEKYNLLDAQNQARQKAYEVKYNKMADVANLRAQNNAMIAKLKAELPQKQYTQVKTDPDSGEKYVSMGHMIADPQNPDRFVPHEDTRMSIDEYNKFKGGSRSTGSNMMSVAPGSAVVSKTETNPDGSPKVLYTAPNRPSQQDAIAARQQANEAQRHKDALERDKSKQERADLAQKVNRVDTLTNKDLDKWDNAGTPAQKAALLKQAGIAPPTGGKDWFGYGSGDKAPTADQIEEQRDAYEEAMRKKHAKDLGVTDKQLLEGAPAAAVEPSSETGDTTSEPKDDVPDIRTGKDGKQYKIMGTNPDGTIRAVPLAMHDAEVPDDNAVAQQGPDDEENEPSPDNEPDEGESDGGLGGLIDQYQQQSDNAMAQNQNAIASDEDMPPEEEDQGLLTG